MPDPFYGDLPTWIGLLGAGAAFSIGLSQYRTAQRWKRAEFMAAEVKAFMSEPCVATALLLIDYSEIALGRDGRRASATGDLLVVKDETLVRALAIHTAFAGDIESFSEEEMLAREAFDAFFTGLERFEHYLETDLVSADDVRVHLQYWIDKVGNPESGWKPPAFYQAVHAFLNGYEYRGVIHLFQRFGIQPVQSEASSGKPPRIGA